MGISGTGSIHWELEEAVSTGDFLALGLEGFGEAWQGGAMELGQWLTICLLQPEEACRSHQQVGPREVLLLGLW
jgi:hypothetical protein